MFDEVKYCNSFIMVHLLPFSARFGHATEELHCAIAVTGRDRETFEHAAKIQSGFGGSRLYVLIYVCMGPSTILVPA